MRRLLSLIALVFAAAAATGFAAGGKARHVVVIVWDGMRPDFVNEKNTPALFQLGAGGVVFENHHPTYSGLTEGNGAVIFTGAYPAHAGILGDTEYRPEIDPLHAVHMEAPDIAQKGDALSRGHYVGAPTLPEILHRSRRKTAVAGAKGISLLADRNTGPDLFAGGSVPADLFSKITQAHGEFPELVGEQPTRDDWTTQALLEPLWHDGVPDFSILWMNEPDLAQHRTGVGSEHSLAMIRNADDNLARVLRALEDHGARDSTDVLVVSDHGFSTISAVVDVADSLQTAGIEAHRQWSAPPKRGDVMVVGNGGSVFVYVIGHDDSVVKRVVNFFQGWNRTGVIFTGKAMPGTFSLAQVHNDAPTAPDVMVSLRWTAEKNEVGAPGMLFSDVSTYGAGQGMHCSLSRFDMHNTLIAAGPDFRPGVVDHLPTGNVDVAPTVLWIMGFKPPKTMDGRVLTEALTFSGPPVKTFEPGHVETTAASEKGVWQQYLTFTEVNGVVYFDEGNGHQSAN
jgi:arylsulfatase A-like enzyme